MFCEQCGKEFGVDAKFCGGCGAPRENGSQKSTEETPDPSNGPNTNETPFDTKVEILASLWMDFRDEPDWGDFISDQELGLPLAYMMANSLVPKEAVLGNFGEELINETFVNLLTAMAVSVDSGFDNLDQIVLE